MPRIPDEGTTVLCAVHNRRVTAVSRDGHPVLVHVGGNGEAYCSGQKFTITRREPAGREAAIAVLAGTTGEDEEHA